MPQILRASSLLPAQTGWSQQDIMSASSTKNSMLKFCQIRTFSPFSFPPTPHQGSRGRGVTAKEQGGEKEAAKPSPQ